ncbi:hypothetical protein GIB67_026665 [Kingdonia uniflora]|uniref:START domain-containing protein n=1 Tax=Kingdonia uniflora TaxID=39325 RepID=A0A7J7MGM5_9MAGN|nr:hypothetical protein GIB67_026665 [Kingdonia uniflora]
MDELVKMAQTDEPHWIPSLVGGRETSKLNHDEYRQLCPPCIGMKPSGFVTEAARETVIIDSLALVEILMDANRWAEMFSCMIARTSTAEVISGGVGRTKNGALQLMHGELQVLSPLVPIREVNFLRFCKQHTEGVWAVVDVSVDMNRDTSNPQTFVSSRRLPLGCVVQDMPNGYSKVTTRNFATFPILLFLVWCLVDIIKFWTKSSQSRRSLNPPLSRARAYESFFFSFLFWTRLSH